MSLLPNKLDTTLLGTVCAGYENDAAFELKFVKCATESNNIYP